MRLQGRNTTATVRLTTDLPNIRPVRLQVGPARGVPNTGKYRRDTGIRHTKVERIFERILRRVDPHLTFLPCRATGLVLGE
jgi:hypothetical protein